MKRKPTKTAELFLSCEHAGRLIPRKYKTLFAKNQGVLKTHRGSDPGALDIAKLIARQTSTLLHAQKVSRLIVDMNRSTESPTALSRWTKKLSPESQQLIFDEIYWPYRNRIFKVVFAKLRLTKSRKPIIHFGIHSFSPYIDKSRVGCDIGILFDPRSRLELRAAQLLRENLTLLFPDLGVAMNFPYRGDADGLTTDLRKHFGKKNYAGMEIEFNQAFLRKLKKRRSLRSFASNFSICLTSMLADL